MEKKLQDSTLENQDLRTRLQQKAFATNYDPNTLQGVAVQRVEELQRQIKELQNDHHDEVLQYKGKVTTLEFEVKNKTSQIEVLSSKLKKTDQELEVSKNRLQSYEVMDHR